MSLELIVGIATVLGVALAAAQLLQSRRRHRTESLATSHVTSSEAADRAQALREEAVLALTDAAMSLGGVSPAWQETIRAAMQDASEHLQALTRLHSRMRLLLPPNHSELAAFTQAIQAFYDLSEVVSQMSETHPDRLMGKAEEVDHKAQLDALMEAQQSFHVASMRYEETAREAAQT